MAKEYFALFIPIIKSQVNVLAQQAIEERPTRNSTTVVNAPDFCFYSDDHPDFKNLFWLVNGRGELLSRSGTLKASRTLQRSAPAGLYPLWPVFGSPSISISNIPFAKDQNDETVVGSQKLISIFCYT